MSANQRNRYPPSFMIPTASLRLPRYQHQGVPLIRAPVIPPRMLRPHPMLPSPQMHMAGATHALNASIVRIPQSHQFPSNATTAQLSTATRPRLLGPALISAPRPQRVVVGSPIIQRGVPPRNPRPVLSVPMHQTPLITGRPLIQTPSNVRHFSPLIGSPIIRQPVGRPPLLRYPVNVQNSTMIHSSVVRHVSQQYIEVTTIERKVNYTESAGGNRGYASRRDESPSSSDRRRSGRERSVDSDSPRGRSESPKRSRGRRGSDETERNAASPSPRKHRRRRDNDTDTDSGSDRKAPNRKRHCASNLRRLHDGRRRVVSHALRTGSHHRRHPRGRRDDRDRGTHTVRTRTTNTDDDDDKQTRAKAIESTPPWQRCSPADPYFTRHGATGCVRGTQKMLDLESRVRYELCERGARVRISRPAVVCTAVEDDPPEHHHHHHHHDDGSSSSSDSNSDMDMDAEESEDDNDEENDEAIEDSLKKWREVMKDRKNHPDRLHEDLWYNDPGETNDGKLCRCSWVAQQTGIRHEIYPGEEAIPPCDTASNCRDRLHHYRITISPSVNFVTNTPTVIEHDNHKYVFEGFSLFSHYKIPAIPPYRLVRFYTEYTVNFVEEDFPENFTVESLDLFTYFLFHEILELVDINWKGPGMDDGCNRYHMMPRFTRGLPDNGKEILSMNEVLKYLLGNNRPVIPPEHLREVHEYHQEVWQRLADGVRGMIVTSPAKKPSSLRVDQLDRQQDEWEKGGKSATPSYPLIIHFGLRPAQASYAGEPKYQKKFRMFMKYKHILACKPKVTAKERQRLGLMGEGLQSIKEKSALRREVTVEISSEGFLRTGINSDVCQHALILPIIVAHLRFHRCLASLEELIGYTFNDRSLLQLAVTHDSHPINYGTNPDHARNSLSNCGIRRPEYGNRKVHYVYTRKKGINVLMAIMARLGEKDEQTSKIPHNERLEYLGDSVIEFLTSIHLFFMFPWLEEGGLTTYRSAIVQNQNLATLAKKIRLQEFMLYAHGPDLCYERYLKHAMANCYEALMGALFLDGGIDVVDRIFSKCIFDDKDMHDVWANLDRHPLQMAESNGDRHWVDSSPVLEKLIKFEESIGVEFTHIRLLARAFTFRSVGYNNLTLGHNQRLEFLGDTVLQFVASEYLYKHFPSHHEGHLTILRSSLVNKRTQSIVCDDLGMTDYIITVPGAERHTMKMKEKADLLEAFVGALYVDKGLDYCIRFCSVCFFPRLKDFIMYQDWNDAKSNLQQICLTLRELDGKEPELPTYKILECIGPTNSRRYTVAVYFKNKRLATGYGCSIQLAQMAAARNALCSNTELFPIILHQKRFLPQNKRRRITRIRHMTNMSSLRDKSRDTTPSSSKQSPVRDETSTTSTASQGRGSVAMQPA